MNALELPPDVLLALRALGLDIEAAKARVQVWMTAHPGLTPSVDDVWREVSIEITPERLQQAAFKAIEQGWAWLTTPSTKIIKGDAPSNFG